MGRFVKMTTAAYAAVGLGALGLLGCDNKAGEPDPNAEQVVAAAAQAAPEAPAEAEDDKKKPELDPSAKYEPPEVDVEPPKTFGKNASVPDWPDLTMVDQDGKEVKFYEDLVKGKTVVINFFYATCDGT